MSNNATVALEHALEALRYYDRTFARSKHPDTGWHNDELCAAHTVLHNMLAAEQAKEVAEQVKEWIRSPWASAAGD